MVKKYVDPVTTKEGGPMGGESVTHPAFAMIGVSRISGQARLAGSDFQHQHYMEITLRYATQQRSLSRDWWFGRNEIVRVSLSESQWATFVSSPNVGYGSPCTLQHVGGETLPGLADPKEDRTQQIKREAKAKCEDAFGHLDKLAAKIEAMGLSAKKAKELIGEVNMAKQQLTSNLPFVLEQFGEFVEDTVEAGKTEINAYAEQTLMRTGLAALGIGESPIKMLSSKKFFCTECKSEGFEPSKTGKGCTFCDGTEGGAS